MTWSAELSSALERTVALGDVLDTATLSNGDFAAASESGNALGGQVRKRFAVTGSVWRATISRLSKQLAQG